MTTLKFRKLLLIVGSLISLFCEMKAVFLEIHNDGTFIRYFLVGSLLLIFLWFEYLEIKNKL